MRTIVPQSILAWLCHYANADPSGRGTFYVLKDRLLRQYAEFQGYDIQEIVKECWGDDWHEYGYRHGCSGPGCRRCGGTGIYARKWVRLQRWQWGKYTFHIPDVTLWAKPDSVQIHGRIKHADYGKASREAELWLYLATLELGMWWKVLSMSSYCSPGWWPMCRLQCWAMWARMKFSRRTCWCGKRFFTWGTGWHLCKTCRQVKTYLDQDNEVPF